MRSSQAMPEPRAARGARSIADGVRLVRGGFPRLINVYLVADGARRVLPRLWRRWDSGPVRVARTLKEGDVVAGFEIVHLPGHAPGEIALWRRSDRLALASDCFFTINIESGRKGAARLPPAVLTQDPEQARASMLKLAALEPAAAWPGHGDPLLIDVRATLEHAASRS